MISLDRENRDIKGEVEALRANKNKISKEIGKLMGQGLKEEAEKVKAEVARDLISEFAGEFLDRLFALDDEAEGWALDATSGNGAWDLLADDAGEIETDEHIESLASLLRGDHIHVDSAWVFNGFF